MGKPFKPSSLPNGIQLTPIKSSVAQARRPDITTTTNACSSKPLVSTTSSQITRSKSLQQPEKTYRSTSSDASTGVHRLKISNVLSLADGSKATPVHTGLIKNPNDPKITGIIPVASGMFEQAKFELQGKCCQSLSHLSSAPKSNFTAAITLSAQATSVSTSYVLTSTSKRPLPLCVTKSTRSSTQGLDALPASFPRHPPPVNHNFAPLSTITHSFTNIPNVQHTGSVKELSKTSSSGIAFRRGLYELSSSVSSGDIINKSLQPQYSSSFKPWLLGQGQEDTEASEGCISPNLELISTPVRLQSSSTSQTTCSAIPEEDPYLNASSTCSSETTSLASLSGLIPEQDMVPHEQDTNPVNLLMIPDPDLPRGPDLKLFERFLSDLDSDMIQHTNNVCRGDWLEPPTDCCVKIEDTD